MILQLKLENFKNEIVDKEWFGSHPHEFLNIRIMGKFHGVAASAHPLVLKNFKAKGNFAFAVIDFTDFMNREIKARIKYAPISKFPSSRFDCTVLINKDEPSGNVLSALKKCKIKEMTSSLIADVFSLNDKQNSVTVTVTFEDPNKTLDSDFIKTSESTVVATLEKAGYPLKQ